MSRNKSTDLTAIREWYQDRTGELELSEHQELKRKRLLLVQSMLSDAKLNQDIIDVLMNDHDLSNAQAYRDLRDATILYGDIRKAEKEGQRYIIYDLALKAYNAAKDDGNVKQMNAAVTNMVKITGVDKEDPDMPDFEKLQPSVYPIILAPEAEAFFTQMLATPGAINLSKLYKDAEAIESESIDQKGDQAAS